MEHRSIEIGESVRVTTARSATFMSAGWRQPRRLGQRTGGDQTVAIAKRDSDHSSDLLW